MPTLPVLRGVLAAALLCARALFAQSPQVRVVLGNGTPAPMEGRLLLIVSADSTDEPRLRDRGAVVRAPGPDVAHARRSR